ncbi:hypothetical protein R1flu_012381 [Riccia fluitans]|uniref:Uncharacterized protein n=1 Tax=Riccia fluitans TaxID=41844 RepID=A0ABD1ZCX5_9MARC
MLLLTCYLASPLPSPSSHMQDSFVLGRRSRSSSHIRNHLNSRCGLQYSMKVTLSVDELDVSLSGGIPVEGQGPVRIRNLRFHLYR